MHGPYLRRGMKMDRLFPSGLTFGRSRDRSPWILLVARHASHAHWPARQAASRAPPGNGQNGFATIDGMADWDIDAASVVAPLLLFKSVDATTNAVPIC